MPRTLKVFQAQIGFYDMVVAAPSQAAALRAFGTTRNLFAEGVARIATDEQAIEAALAQPEVPQKRAIGTVDRFGLNPGLPRFPDLPPADPPTKRAKPGKPALTVVPKPAPPPDRSALDAAEAAFERLKARRTDEEATFRERRAALDADEAQARAAHAEARQAAEADIERARVAYVKAGGKVPARR